MTPKLPVSLTTPSRGSGSPSALKTHQLVVFRSKTKTMPQGNCTPWGKGSPGDAGILFSYLSAPGAPVPACAPSPPSAGSWLMREFISQETQPKEKGKIGDFNPVAGARNTAPAAAPGRPRSAYRRDRSKCLAGFGLARLNCRCSGRV
jgi:hypothetical protein